MSQLSLLLQSKLQNLKLKKNQSAQWISEVKDHPDWSELKPKSKGDQIDNLILLAYVFHVHSCGSSKENYQRVADLSNCLLSHHLRLCSYPSFDEVERYGIAVVCTCGNVISEGTEWGLLKHCSSCKTPYSTRFHVPMFQDAIARSGCATREWAEWAQVQAILLRNKRNLRIQTARESLDSEKEND